MRRKEKGNGRMKKLLYNVDGFQIGIKEQKMFLQMNGWVLFSREEPYKVWVIHNGKEDGNVQVSFCKREDVAKAYPQYPAVGTVGFDLFWEIEFAELNMSDKLSVVAVCGTDVLLLWQTDSSGIGRYLKTTIAYAVDQITVDDTHVVLAGWGISKVGEMPLEYEVRSSEGKEIEIACRRTNRRDAIRAVLGEDSEAYCGFNVKFEYEKGKRYDLILRNGVESVRYHIGIRDAQKEQKKRNRLYLPARDIIKSYRLKMLRKDLKTLKSKGWDGLKDEWKGRYASETGRYDIWYLKHRATAEELKSQRKDQFSYMPVVSIIVPAYRTPEKFLRQMIASVKEQSYSHWELCIADGSGENGEVEKAIQQYLSDNRIKYKKLDQNMGISGNTNAALDLASGEIIMLLDHDDILAPEALYEFVKAFNENPEVDSIYSDEDKISMDLKRHFDPHFKTDFNLDLLRSNNYICHLFAVRKTIVEQVGGFREEFDGSQDYDFILRCTEVSKKVAHIPKILYHWRMHQQSTAANPESKMYCYEAGKRAIEAHLKRQNVSAKVMMQEHLGYYSVDYEKKGTPFVSILIPNKDESECLRRCIESIFEKTLYRNFEILVIENNSTEEETFAYYKELEKNPQVRVIYWDGIFNYSAINNFGTKEAKGEYFLLLNNDTEVISPEWLDMMLADCQRKEIGAVGCKLLYPDDTIQHCGVVIGMGGIAGHIFNGLPRESTGYFARTKVQQDFSAVTAACLMVSREVYMQLNGLDEKLKIAFNDVDFCLRIREAGYLIMLEPRVLLYHHESKSRGQEDTLEKMKRFDSEVEYMKTRWARILEDGDPYYNRNLTLKSGDCSLR